MFNSFSRGFCSFFILPFVLVVLIFNVCASDTLITHSNNYVERDIWIDFSNLYGACPSSSTFNDTLKIESDYQEKEFKIFPVMLNFPTLGDEANFIGCFGFTKEIVEYIGYKNSENILNDTVYHYEIHSYINNDTNFFLSDSFPTALIVMEE